MADPGPIRLGAISFVLSGVVWFALGLLALLGYLQAIPGREDVVLYLVAHLLLAVGLVGLHASQKDHYGLLGRAGFYIALAAVAARALGAAVFLAGSVALEWVSLPSTVGMLVGFVLYGVATVRARVLPRWYGLALVVALPVTLPLATYGTTLFGLLLLALGYVLWLRRGATTAQPSRVRRIRGHLYLSVLRIVFEGLDYRHLDLWLVAQRGREAYPRCVVTSYITGGGARCPSLGFPRTLLCR